MSTVRIYCSHMLRIYGKILNFPTFTQYWHVQFSSGSRLGSAPQKVDVSLLGYCLLFLPALPVVTR